MRALLPLPLPLLLLFALAACGGDSAPGALTRSEDRQLDAAAAAIDVNAMDGVQNDAGNEESAE